MFMYRHKESIAEKVSEYLYLPVKNVVYLHEFFELNGTG